MANSFFCFSIRFLFFVYSFSFILFRLFFLRLLMRTRSGEHPLFPVYCPASDHFWESAGIGGVLPIGTALVYRVCSPSHPRSTVPKSQLPVFSLLFAFGEII
jgi:hypothetical protein